MKKLLMLSSLLFCSFTAFSEKEKSFAPGTMQKKKEATTYQPYGFFELRHHLNTYYNGYFVEKREPLLQSRLQLGMSAYENSLDIYTTLGVTKRPETQAYDLRRAELNVDYTFISGVNGWVMLYNIVKQASDEDLSDETPVGASEFTIGLAPIYKLPVSYNGSTVVFKFGGDVATKMYDKPQYIEIEEDTSGIYSGLGLKGEGSEVVEDYAQRIYTQLFSAVELSPSYVKDGKIEVGAFVDRRFKPRYELDGKSVVYTYEPEQTSHYRMRLSYGLTNKISIINDFYHYFDGAFDNEADQLDRRYRNVLRMSVSLH